MKTTTEARAASGMPATAARDAEIRPRLAGAEAEVWTERMLSALVNGVKGGKWFSLMDKVFAPKTLALAWAKVRANKGAAGVDGQSIERFAAKADLYLSELSAALREGTYRPQPVKRVDIPKGDGRTRPLGIPTVKDRIVQQAVRLVIEPIFEHGFADGSYGFRPKRGCHDALREVDELIGDGYTFVVDADLKSYFDTIPHDCLVARIEEHVIDGGVLDLVRGWLKADILKGLDRWTPTAGSPQGAVISPLLANIYLDPLDKLMAARGYRMVRYADDFVILCRTREAADAALDEVRAWVEANGLTLHPEKTHVGDCRAPGQGFEFLGYRFEAGRRNVRKKSLDKLKDTIRGTDAADAGRQPRCRHRGPQPGAPRLVRLLQARPVPHLHRSRQAHPSPASRAPAQTGEATGHRAHRRRSKALAKCLLRGCRAVRALPGLAYRETVSMKKPPTGEPYAGKPPVRFGGRGRRKPIPTPIQTGIVEFGFRCPRWEAGAESAYPPAITKAIQHPWAILVSRTCSNLQGACYGEQGTARQSREKETEERKAQAARANLLVLAGHLWLEERRRQEGLINHSTVWCARASICPKLQAPGAGCARPGRRSLRG